jgi:hypothetical protein
MKMACYLLIATIGIFVAATGASADPLASDPSDNPYLQCDPDGVPLSVTQPQSQQPSPEELKAARKQEEKAALNKDWLLRDYEHQLHAHAAANSPQDQDQDANLYYKLTSNKELAELAGLPTLDPDGQDGTSSYRTGAAYSDQGAVTLRSDTSSTSTSNFSSQGDLFKPLVTPLSAPDMAGLHNFYAPLPVSMASPLSGFPKTSPAPTTDQSRDSSDIETPGMVAAEKDPLTDTSALDLSLDTLPGETVEQARAHRQNNSNLELPLPMDVDQLHKEQAATLSVPGAPKTAQTATPAPVKTVPTEDPDAPLPVNKALQINPVHAPIANPYDILNR